MSIAVISLVLAFGINKFMLCWEYQETNHQTSIIKDAYDMTQEYQLPKFSMAFAVLGSHFDPIEYDRFVSIDV